MRRHVKQAAVGVLVVVGAGAGGVAFAEDATQPANCHASKYDIEYEFNAEVSFEPDHRSDDTWLISSHGATFRAIGDPEDIPVDADNDYDLEIRETDGGELRRSITTPDTIDYLVPYAARVKWPHAEGVWLSARFTPRFDYRGDIDATCRADTASFTGLVLPAEPPAVCPPGEICV